MSYGINKLGTRTKLMAGALALILAGVSHASGTQVGGGATLPSIAYNGSNAASQTQLYGTTGANAIATGSLFGQYMAQSGNPGVSYCLTGSGAGKNILASATVSGVAYNVQYACPKNSDGSQSGFNAPLVSRTDLVYPNFVGADSPLASSDLTNYQSVHGSTAWPTQFPVISGAVAIGFNLMDNTGVLIPSADVNFTDTQVCLIFSGTATAWNDSRLASAFTLAAGHSVPATPIAVQYRSDGSGTTFSLSNHLAYNCASAGLSNVFETSQNFVGTGGVVSNFPAQTNWTGSSGNVAVATAINKTNGAVGYVEYANAVATSPTLQIADVNGKSPSANFGTALPVTSAAIVYNEVISATNATNGTAQLTAISGAPSTKCIALIPPADYAVPGSKGGIIPTTSYPIVAVSYFMGNAQGNESTDLPYTANLVNAPYNTTITSKVTTVGAGTGFAFLTLGTGAFAATAPGSCLG